MTELLMWMGKNWFLTWMIIWGGSWIGMAIINGVAKIMYEVAVAIIKAIPIIFRGWPPEYMDDY